LIKALLNLFKRLILIVKGGRAKPTPTPKTTPPRKVRYTGRRRPRPLSSYRGKGLRKLAQRSKKTRTYERRAGFDFRKKVEE